MKKLPLILLVLGLLYLLMRGWNSTMYREFPALLISNYWMFVCLVFLTWFILRGIRAIR